jgi:hypothetical protein
MAAPSSTARFSETGLTPAAEKSFAVRIFPSASIFLTRPIWVMAAIHYQGLTSGGRQAQAPCSQPSAAGITLASALSGDRSLGYAASSTRTALLGHGDAATPLKTAELEHRCSPTEKREAQHGPNLARRGGLLQNRDVQ